MTILEKITKGESRILEFKEAIPSSKNFSKTIVSFSNGSGGELLLGVKDTGEIIGIDENKIIDLRDKISNMIYDSILPVVIPEIYSVKLKNKTIIVVHVFSGILKPYYLKSEGKPHGVYVRVGATNKKADRSMLQQLEREQSNITFDALTNFDFNDPVDWKFVEDLIGKKLTPPVLQNLKLVKKESGQKFLTNGALIISGLFENAYMSCARFKGESTEIFIDQKEYRGNLFSQLNNIEIFLKNHLMLHGEINGFKRDDKLEIPLLALREAIINAFVHRDYSITGSNIKLAIFDSRVIITSPGVLPGSISLENILDEQRSEIRNPVLARIFKEANLIEQWGTGFTKIKKACLDAGLELPIIRESANFLQIIFKRPKSEWRKSGEKVAKKWRKSGEKMPVATQESTIIDHLKKHAHITSIEVKEMFHVQDSRARKILSIMAEKGILKKQGKTKSTYYILN